MRRALFAIAGVLFVALAFSPPAASQAPAPDALAAARELVATMRLTDQVPQLMPIIMRALRPAITRGQPEVERDFDRLAPAIADAFSARAGEFIDEVATLYAQHFTKEELGEVMAFYRGPTGQKFLQKMPMLTQESMALGQRFGERLAPQLQERMLEELRRKGHKI
jgi:uncharacterized protein